MAALRIDTFNLIPLKISKTPKSNPYRSTAHLNYPTPKLQFSISCSKNGSSDLVDTELASKFAREADRINFQKLQREDALNKSRELLFKEVCSHMEMEDEEEAKKKWRRMSEDDKWVFVNDFVSKWGADFHPLSKKSVKQLLDEYIMEEEEGSDSSASTFIGGFKKFIGFPSIEDDE